MSENVDSDLVEYSADELAREADTLTTTVRMYQAKGLLHPPERRGRKAVYDASHLERIRLINSLQERGHSLAGIADLLDARERGAGLSELLGARSWSDPDVARLPAPELLRRLGGEQLSPAVMMAAVEQGLVELDGDEVVVRDERFLLIGERLVAMGVAPDRVLSEWIELRQALRPVVDRFVDVFDEQVAPGLEGSQLSDVGTALDELIDLARSVTLVALDERLRQRAAERLPD